MTTTTDGRRELPATAQAVLGVLSFETELSGYDVKQWCDQSLAFFYWSPSHSQIYAELRRLEAAGLAVSRVEQTHPTKSRRLYSITDAGREEARGWARRRDQDAVVLKHHLLLRLWGAHVDGAAGLDEMLAAHQIAASARADAADGHAERSAAIPEWRYASLALEWSARFWRDEADRAAWMRERVARIRADER